MILNDVLSKEKAMSSLNKVFLIGRLGTDPEVKHTASGVAVASLSVATDESYTSKDGQKVEKTEWHRVVAWGKQAEFCGNYLAKGRLIYVEGKLETRKWQDQAGVERYTTEVNASRVLALGKGQNQPTDESHQGGQYSPAPAQTGPHYGAPF